MDDRLRDRQLEISLRERELERQRLERELLAREHEIAESEAKGAAEERRRRLERLAAPFEGLPILRQIRAELALVPPPKRTGGRPRTRDELWKYIVDELQRRVQEDPSARVRMGDVREDVAATAEDKFPHLIGYLNESEHLDPDQLRKRRIRLTYSAAKALR